MLPADKGNAMVVLNTEYYKQKIRDVLDLGTYKMLLRDPTGSVVQKTDQLVRQSSLSNEVKKVMQCADFLPPS